MRSETCCISCGGVIGNVEGDMVEVVGIWPMFPLEMSFGFESIMEY